LTYNEVEIVNFGRTRLIVHPCEICIRVTVMEICFRNGDRHPCHDSCLDALVTRYPDEFEIFPKP
jgi:hypothetical protein